MQKATEFSKTEVVFVAVNSIITKLFLVFPATLISIGKSASLLLVLLIILLGYLILFAVSMLYKKFDKQSILKITEFAFGKFGRAVYSYLLSAMFLVVNGLFLRCVSESINMSLMPNVNVNIISLIFIAGVSVAVFSGLKAIVRTHAVIVPVTLAVVAVLFSGSISSFDVNNIYPIFADGLSSFLLGSLLCSYFADYFVVTLIFPYMQKKTTVKEILNRCVIISSIVLAAVVAAVLLAVEDNTIIPVFKLGQSFRAWSYTPRLESVFTAAWFLSFFLNFSVLLYFSCKLFSGGEKSNKVIVPFSFIAFGLSIVPKNIYEVSKYLDILSVARLILFFAVPLIILITANIKARRQKL